MGDLYSIDEGGGEWFNLAAEYDTPLEAEIAAAAVGHPGVAVPRVAYLASPSQLSAELAGDIERKIGELTAEGNRRCVVVSPAFVSVKNGMATGLGIKASSLTAEGGAYVAVAQAYADAVPVIRALPNTAAVDAYDVVTDPAWP